MNDERSLFLTYALQWVPAIPLLLTCVIGILVALLNLSTRRGPSVLVLIALVLIGAETLIVPVGSIYLTTYCQQRAMNMAQIGYTLSAFRAAMLLLVAVGVALLLVAVFYRRPAVVSAVPPLPSSPPPFR